MKKQKLSISNVSTMLSKAQLKAITAGSGTGTCGTYNMICNDATHENCCSHYYCEYISGVEGLCKQES